MAGAGFSNLAYYFQQYGVLDFLLPFVLSFTIIYAVTGVLPLFKDHKNFRVIIALSIALTFVVPHILGTYPLGYDPVQVLNETIPSISLIAISVVMLLILMGLFSGVLLWGDLSNPYIWLLIFVVGSFGILGALDDYKKIKNNNSTGLSSKFKIFIQVLLSLIAISILYFYCESPEINYLYFPFFKNLVVNLGFFFIPFYVFVIVGSSNAVNLTDGLDGLATVPVILVASCFAFISYVTGNIVFSEYLQIPYIDDVGEITIFCGSIIGACLGFLWFNAPPAKIFMGDTGSLSLGGSLGAVSIITKHEIVLAITGGLFVLEAISVIVQVVSYKLTGKRVFIMAPIHHHFEKKGWAESTVVIRFWIISIILAMIGLATLKLR